AGSAGVSGRQWGSESVVSVRGPSARRGGSSSGLGGGSARFVKRDSSGGYQVRELNLSSEHREPRSARGGRDASRGGRIPGVKVKSYNNGRISSAPYVKRAARGSRG
ncbi:MAG: hypothetical protein IAB19_07425, partial [Proteobacteria bacterium]|nr:hypothetical protein [Candidatus Avisuccinivibrio stercorigallinarum]